MRTALISIAILLSAGFLYGAPAADIFVIPIAGHVTGADGQTWITDVTLHNVTSTDLIVDLAGFGSDGALIDLNAATVSIAAHGSMTLRDVVRESDVGALVVAGSGLFTMTSRIYSDGPRGSVGSDITPVHEFLDADSGQAVLPALIASSDHRTNIGFFAVADATDLHLEVILLDATGVTLGSRSFVVTAGTIAHRHISSRETAPIAFDEATARVRVTSGDGVVTTYASVVDNTSSDASFIPASIVGADQITTLKAATAAALKVLRAMHRLERHRISD